MPSQPNSYYKDKEVTVSKLKQFTLLPLQTLDVASQAQEKKETKIEKFQAIQDSEGKYAFFIKPENEKSFSIYPMKEHLNAYFNVMGKDNKLQMHKALAQKYYDMAYRYPDAKQQLIMPNTDGIDMSRLEKVRICADKNDPKTKVVIATVDGERMQKPISNSNGIISGWLMTWMPTRELLLPLPLSRGSINQSKHHFSLLRKEKQGQLLLRKHLRKKKYSKKQRHIEDFIVNIQPWEAVPMAITRERIWQSIKMNFMKSMPQ